MRILSFPAALSSLGRKVELLALQRTTRDALEVVSLGGKRGLNGGRGSGDLDVVTHLTRLEMHTEEIGRRLQAPE